MRTRLLRALAAVFAFTLILAACGSDDESGDTSSTTLAPTATEAADGTADAAPADEEMTDEEVADEEMTDEAAAADDIVSVAIASGEFPTLVAALEAADLVGTLQGDGPFTVFAPTEEAFAAALTALDLTAEELLADTELLTSVLTYHVIADEVMAETVVTLDGEDVATVNGATVAISVAEDGTVMVNDATVVQTDIAASNGVIHVIDTVLLPPAGE
ncbi:MAG: fasciclin domain-containing protein [Acidimicrobiia bacterium]|nr:fasciclin domain-containing protein [Acidimicrobiia bacterium]